MYFEDPDLPGVRKPFLSISSNGDTQHHIDEQLPDSFTLSTQREVCFLSQHYERDSNGKTREVLSFRGTLDSDLILALTRPTAAERLRARTRGFKAGGYDFRYACLLASIACERCSNVLLYQHGTKHGYALHSEKWKDCPTQCEFCEDEPKFKLKSRNKLTLVAALLLAGCSSPAPSPVPLESSTPAHDAAATIADAGKDAAATIADAGKDAAATIADAGKDAAAALPDASPDAAATLPDASPDAAATLPDTGPDTEASTLSSVSDAATTTDADISSSDAGSDAATCPIPTARGSECDLVTSCGCAEGFVCRTADLHTGQTLCFPAGNQPAYSACEFDQDCTTDTVCEGSLCRPRCDIPETLCSDESWCGKIQDEGRTVCLGSCNPIIFDKSRWVNSTEWIELQATQFERGLNLLPLRTLDFPGCGAGAYCSPGAENISPFPYCTASTGTADLGTKCQAHSDCVSGLGCSDKTCRSISYVDPGCATGTDLSIVPNWKAPDGYGNLGVCLPE